MRSAKKRARDKHGLIKKLPSWASTRQASMSNWTLPSASRLTNQRPVLWLTTNHMPGIVARDRAGPSAMLA